MIEEAFRTGRLLLSETPSEGMTSLPAEFPFTESVLMVVFILLALMTLKSFIGILPFLSDSVLRARGSAALENSVRVCRDRNIIALVLLLPAVLLLYRYRLYDPDYVQGMSPDLRMLTVAGVFIGYLLLRFLLYLWLKPRRRSDDYQLAYRAGYTFFILMMLLILVTVGVLYLFHVNDLTVRIFIWAEAAFVYLIYLLRRGQILSLVCNPLTTFLYLCALELLPTALLIASAVVL